MVTFDHSTFQKFPALAKDDFNRLAGQRNLPFLITGRLDDPSILSPEHIEFLDLTAKVKYVKEGAFTKAFFTVYQELVEMKRRESVAVALAQHRTVVIEKDVSKFSNIDKELMRHMTEISKKIDELYMRQKGSFKFIKEIESRKEMDPISHKMFWRNQGPWGVGKGESDPFANALPHFPEKRVGIYPAGVQLDSEFFENQQKNKMLSHQWTVVTTGGDESFEPVRYFKYYAEEMEEIAEHLDLAAKTIEKVEEERAFHVYLQAAAHAFRTGDWNTADEKWVAMNATNSKYALRIAPDETYWEPANNKAGFEFWFAMIDKHYEKFISKIQPFAQDMENEINQLVPAYPAREIKFQVPDCIEMLLRGGDHRLHTRSYLGQKLPNFSDEVSRMVIMTNYGTDKKTGEQYSELANQLLASETLDYFDDDKLVNVTSILLHELTHSFGVQGSSFNVMNTDKKVTSTEALGGQNSSVMEELKAQTGALYWIGWLQQRSVIDDTFAKKLYTSCVMWAFGHISRGMCTSDGSPMTYSQLAAIQIRHLLDSGALTDENGKFQIHFEKMHAAVTELFRRVIEIQVYGDKNKANSLRNDIVSGEGNKVIQMKRIQKIYSVYPSVSYELKIKGV